MTNSKWLKTSVALLVITLSIIGLMFIISSRQLAKSPGTLTWLWRSTLAVTGTSLLASAVVGALAVSWNLSGNSFIRENVCTILSSRTRIVLLAFVLLGFVLPAVLSLFKGALLSPGELAVYAWEVGLSVVVLASAVATVRVLTRRVPGFREMVLLSQTVSEAVAIQNQIEIRLRQAEEAANEALVAFEQGRISRDQAREIEQTLSLIKWIQQGDLTGWYELLEEVRFGDGLCLGMRSIVERELWRAQQERYRTGGRPSRNGNYKKQLQSLLSSLETLSLDEALQAWDRGEISRDRVREIQLLETLKKWIWEEDDLGWYDLQEEIDPGNRLQCLGARLIVEQELWRVQQERYRTGGYPSRNGKYEKQLQSLLSSLEMPSLDDALLVWDRGEISQDKVREVQLLESLKKWIWQEDETGWCELQEEIAPTSRLQHLGARLIVERELWRVQQERHRTRGWPSRDYEYEKQLQSLLLPTQV
jgi:exonuclease VII small subunit